MYSYQHDLCSVDHRGEGVCSTKVFGEFSRAAHAEVLNADPVRIREMLTLRCPLLIVATVMIND
jgi:hypothetical protein